jgi:hypothetical protein
MNEDNLEAVNAVTSFINGLICTNDSELYVENWKYFQGLKSHKDVIKIIWYEQIPECPEQISKSQVRRNKSEQAYIFS